MKFCTRCGAQNDDNALFCTSCGQKTGDPVSPETQTPAQTEFARLEPEITIKNDTPLTLATIKKFYNNIKVCAIIILVAGALLTVTGILSPILHSDEADYTLLICGIVLIACGIVYFWLYYGVYTKNKMFTDKTHTLYLCDEEGITQVLYDGDRETARQRITYAQISKVTKSKEYLLLRFGAQAWLINRNNYILGSDADFLAVLRRHCAPNSVKVK